MMRLPVVSILLTALLCGLAQADDWEPWSVPTAEQRQQQSVTSNEPLQLAVRFFQKYISPVDGPRCPMAPTCSAYSLRALHKHGPLLGVLLTVDRLYHEGDPRERQKPINKWGYLRFFDPLENNDFWLKQTEETD